MERTIESPTMSEALRKAAGERQRQAERKRNLALETYRRAIASEAEGRCRIGILEMGNTLAELGATADDFERHVTTTREAATLEAEIKSLDPAAMAAERDEQFDSAVADARLCLHKAIDLIDAELLAHHSPNLRSVWVLILTSADTGIAMKADELEKSQTAASTRALQSRRDFDEAMAKRSSLEKQLIKLRASLP